MQPNIVPGFGVWGVKNIDEFSSPADTIYNSRHSRIVSHTKETKKAGQDSVTTNPPPLTPNICANHAKNLPNSQPPVRLTDLEVPDVHQRLAERWLLLHLRGFLRRPRAGRQSGKHGRNNSSVTRQACVVVCCVVSERWNLTQYEIASSTCSSNRCEPYRCNFSPLGFLFRVVNLLCGQRRHKQG